MKIEELKFTKKDLEKMPSDGDRILFFQTLNLLTEINILIKLSLYSVKMTENPIIDKSIYSHQIFIVLIKAGKLFEGWEMLRKYFFGNQLSKILEKELDEKGKKGLTYLKDFFGKNKHFAEIRNTMAFHYGGDEIIKQYNDYDDDEPFAIYWSEYATNSFSTTYFSVMERLLKKLDPDNQKATSILFKDITEATVYFRDFIESLIHYYVGKYLGETTEHEIPNEKNTPQHNIPYFANGSYFDEWA